MSQKPTSARVSIAIALAILLLPTLAAAQTYTLSPPPFLLVQNNAGVIINGGCVWTYLAGTSTAATTYSDTSGTANTNPIKADSAGRFTAYLVAGTNYKFVYENTPCTVSPPVHGSVLRTQDNILGVPAAAATTDVTGTAGEAISAGQCVYLSDGSGSKTAGQWYRCDSTNAYSSATPTVGIAPSAIASATAGTIRLAGPVVGLSSLSVGQDHYVSATPGAITSTAPSANVRLVGQADTATSLVVTANQRPITFVVDPSITDARCTLTTAVPVTTADVTAATMVYVTPYQGNRIALFDGTSTWNVRTFTELSIALGTDAADTNYDVFAYDNAGVVAIERLAWTNATTRATALTTQNGVLSKTGALTRKYLCTYRTTGTVGQTEDSYAKRFLSNYYHKVAAPLRVLEAANSWTYTTATLRQANNSTANQLAIVNGWPEDAIDVTAVGNSANDNANITRLTAIGEDSTSAMATGSIAVQLDNTGIGFHQQTMATLRTIPAVGYHYYAWLEYSQAVGTTTWYGDNNTPTLNQAGIIGVWKR